MQTFQKNTFENVPLLNEAANPDLVTEESVLNLMYNWLLLDLMLLGLVVPQRFRPIIGELGLPPSRISM